jgi:hypothetical protein
MFFIAYFLLGVPSNLVLDRFPQCSAHRCPAPF